MVHPRFAKADDATPLPTQLTPVYPTTAGLGQATLRKLVERALAAPIADTLPADWLAKLDLPELEASIRLLHQPPLECAVSDLESRRHPAWQRLAFDELLAQQLSLATARQQRTSRATHPLPARQHLTSAFTRALSFALTAAQARTWQEISVDLAQPHPMRRLLQGDVGSGKTVWRHWPACRRSKTASRPPSWHRPRSSPSSISANWRRSCHPWACAAPGYRAASASRNALPPGRRSPRAKPTSHSAPTRCSRKPAVFSGWGWRWSTSSIVSASASGWR